MSNSTSSVLAFDEASQSTFNFGGHAVRIIVRDGEPWFVATDVCKALGLQWKGSGKTGTLAALDDEEKGAHTMSTPGGQQTVAIISESGLNLLTLRCRDAIKPGAVPYRFRKWVTGEVLPSIRKTGGYGTISQEKMDRALALAGEVAAVAHRHVMQAVLSEKEPWEHDRWVFMCNLRDPRLNMGNGFVSNGWAKRIPWDVVMETPSELAESIRRLRWNVKSEDLANIISACAYRLELRSRKAQQAIAAV